MAFGRYEEINGLLDDVLKLPSHERAAFIERSCGADTGLHDTLNALLAAHELENGFLDAPALLQLGADQNSPPWVDLSGSIISGYQVVRPLGAGALAEVWLAEDKRLQRRVALKILRMKFARDASQMLRFEQEARSASKLSHPNIVTIHEIGEDAGFHFIAQEFVDGVTLRTQLSSGHLPFQSILDIAVQVAAALAAAHNSGIIHRDIKPENLMIRTDGLVKVLDFGIARAIEEGPNREDDWRRVGDSLTTPGMILGTVKYMSPEQARGLPLDHRSDLFSLGVVLYEMAAGKAPFQGATNADTLAAVLAEHPAPLSVCRPETPPQLAELIQRCLEKDRDQRFSSAEDLCAELKSLSLRSGDSTAIAPQNSTPIAAPNPVPPFATKRVLAASAALVVIAVLVALAWRVIHPITASLPFDSPEMTRLTLPGPVTDAAISPDGQNVGYVLQMAGAPGIWIRQLASTLDKRIATLEPGNYRDVVYSPDGAYLYYFQATSLAAALYRIPSTGGRPEKVTGNVAGRVSIAPDSRHIAFVRLDPTRWEESLLVANSDGSHEHVLTTRRRPYYFSRIEVAWSSDGKSIFCLGGKEPFYSANAYHIVQVELSSGRETPVAARSWARVGSLISAVNGRTLIVAASEHSDEDLQLWRVSYPDGHVARITRDLSNYAKLSLSSNAQTLLAIRRERTGDLWIMPVGNPDGASQVSNGDIPGLSSAALTKNGDLIYSASTGQFLNLWKMNAAGQNFDQLSRANADQTEVAATPDGRYVLYQSGGKIWRMDAHGSSPKQLTTGNLDVHPVASPDSKWVVYASFRGWSPDVGGRPMIWRVPIDGGEPVQITQDINSLPAVSPDGRLVACAYYLLDPPQSVPKVAVYPFQGGPAIRMFDRPAGSDDKVYWSADGHSLEYIVSRADVSNIWRQPLGGGGPAPITHFAADRLIFLSPSPDRQQLVLGRGKKVTELVLITQGH